MPLNRDLQDLSRSALVEARPPDAHPDILHLLMASWRQRDEATRTRPMSNTEARVRHSNAGRCARAIGYWLTGVEPSNPPSEADFYRFAIGRIVHDEWQQDEVAALTEAGWTDLAPEAPCAIEHFGRPLTAGHADLFGIDPDGRRVMFELKTINGFGYKNLIGLGNDPAGPRPGDLTQGALNAYAMDCDRLVMVYLAMELIGPSIAARHNLPEISRFAAQFSFTRQQYTPIALAELDRLIEIVDAVELSQDPPRRIPDPSLPIDHEITNPKRGAWQVEVDGYIMDSGTTWQCNYCPFQDHCASS